MRPLSRTKALAKLQVIKGDLRAHVTENYEHRAKDCGTCETKGACCLDEHFVNVRISRLEADAIRAVIDRLLPIRRAAVFARAQWASESLELTGETYACPLYDAAEGCLVHAEAKPLACILHACYENKADLPPEHLLAEQEARVEELNDLTYGRDQPRLPIPLAIRRQFASAEACRPRPSSVSGTEGKGCDTKPGPISR